MQFPSRAAFTITYDYMRIAATVKEFGTFCKPHVLVSEADRLLSENAASGSIVVKLLSACMPSPPADVFNTFVKI